MAKLAMMPGLGMVMYASYAQGLHVDWLNREIDPGQNFFEFANGGWQKNNPIPPDFARWGIFQKLQEKNQELIHGLLKKLSEKKYQQTDSIEQKLGDFYFSGMNEVTINQLGSQPIQSELESIKAITNIKEMQKVVAHLQLIGVDALFSFGQMQDYKNNRHVIGVAFQSGLGLPDRDYYIKNDVRFKKIRQLYTEHIAKMFELLGDKPEQAMNQARIVMKIETRLATFSMPRAMQRDPNAIYHIRNLDQLQKITPNFSWKQYFSDLGYPNIESINLATLPYFKAVNAELLNIPVTEWKIYLRWHVIQAFAPFLADNFVEQDFKLMSVLTGVKSLLPRWKRVVHVEDQALGFAIGKLYIEKYFSVTEKEAAQVILDNIRDALKNDLEKLPWMTLETRKAALQKLKMMEARIGYPSRWRDYSTLKIDRGSYVSNIMRANEFLNRYALNKIGKPVDKEEWEMTPQTINAYYDPSLNQLNIPAGILQPPFYDKNAPASVNYGGIGSVIGHEMTHGFDDQGAQFDAQGNLKNWWTASDLKNFKTRTQCIANQFSQFTVDGGVHLQGQLVVGEATADLGGLILAYRAFQQTQDYKARKNSDGFTPDQQFFIGAAHVWAANVLGEEARRLALTNPHPPAIYRVNGTVSNMSEFQQAFNLRVGSPMVNRKRCVIW